MNTNTKTHIVLRDGDKPLVFSGWVVGHAEDDHQIMTLYKTIGGQYVAGKVSLANGTTGNERHSGAVCKTLAHIHAFFGFNNVLVQLLNDVGISIDDMDSGLDYEHVE